MAHRALASQSGTDPFRNSRDRRARRSGAAAGAAKRAQGAGCEALGDLRRRPDRLDRHRQGRRWQQRDSAGIKAAVRGESQSAVQL